MGTIRKRNGKFQAQIRRDGVPPLSKTFTMNKNAIVWVRGIEARIDIGETYVAAPKAITLGDVLTRYRQEVTPQKKVGNKKIGAFVDYCMIEFLKCFYQSLMGK